MMDTVYYVQQILKRFGTYIYTGERLGDVELMLAEINELHKNGFISLIEYQRSILILRREKRRTLMKKGD